MACRLVNTNHRDLIHDIAYDFYGKRLATCSSDRTIKVWQLSDAGTWQVTADWAGMHWLVFLQHSNNITH
jgi:nucleoporin SEH1